MNEISVNVQQEVGKISWNFEEIKAMLEEELAVFSKTVYTDDTIKTAKEDLAMLRKLRTSVEENRKEVKDKCLEPYAVIERQAKELTGIIDKPIGVINEKVQEYEKRRKEAVLREINAYWSEKTADLPDELKNKAYQTTYDSRWLNATASKKSWKDAIDGAVQRIRVDLETIKSFNSEFADEMYKAFLDRLQLSDAVATMNKLEAQKQRILEMERKRKEEERRREEERAAAEASLKTTATSGQKSQIGQAIESIDRGNFASAAGNAIKKVNEECIRSGAFMASNCFPSPWDVEGKAKSTQDIMNDLVRAYEKAEGKSGKLFLVHGTDSQYQKIRDYIKFIGAEFEEV